MKVKIKTLKCIHIINGRRHGTGSFLRKFHTCATKLSRFTVYSTCILYSRKVWWFDGMLLKIHEIHDPLLCMLMYVNNVHVF